MKLVCISNRMNKKERSSKAMLRITKNGCIWFTKGAQDALYIEDNSRFSIFQDKDNPREFYIKRGGNIKMNCRKGHCFCGSKETINEITQALGLDPAKNYSFMIAQEPIENDGELFHAIITSKTF